MRRSSSDAANEIRTYPSPDGPYSTPARTITFRSASSRTTTSALFGALREDPSSRAEFLALARNGKGA